MAFPSGLPLGNATRFAAPLLGFVAGLAIGLLLFMAKAGQVSQLQQQVALARQQAAQLEAEKQALSRQLSDAEGQLRAQEEKVSSIRAQLSSATADLDRSRQSLQEAESRGEVLAQERDQLQSRIGEIIGEREEANQRAQRFAKERGELERSVSRLRERLTLLDRDYRRLSEKLAALSAPPELGMGLVNTRNLPVSATSSAVAGAATNSAVPGAVQLPPIVVSRNQSAAMAPAIRGRVVEVNDPHHFVVVDKGSEDGVRVGMVFDVLRDGGAAGRATVIRVRPKLSACDIIRTQTPGPLQVGDLAVQSGL
jgi:uncharacterized membrane-anchored protein YhcB (DUF1043 family)